MVTGQIARRGRAIQLAALLASKTNPPATPGAMPDTRGPATSAGTSHYRTAAALKAALIQSNPGYTGDCQVVTYKERIVEVRLTDAGKRITNIAPLRGLPLQRLKLDVHGSIGDFSPLEGMPLDYLDLGRCSSFNDDSMSVLASMPLTKLRGINATDLGVLKGKRLTSLACGGNVSDLEPLRGMPIEELNIHSVRLTDLGPLQGMPITILDLGDCHAVRDFSILASLPALVGIDVSGTGFSDLSVLKGKHLEYFRIGDALKNIKNRDDMKVLRGMKSLKGINYISVVEFWKRYDAGEFGKP